MTRVDSIEDLGLSTSETNRSVAEAEEQPFPPRYWWLKRIVAGLGLLLVALVLLRVWWGWEVTRRFQAEIDGYIAAGEPILPEDFDPKEDIPDDQNAAKFLMDAAAAITLTPAQTTLMNEVNSEPQTAVEHVAELGAIVSANRRVLELVREARSLEQTDWGGRFSPTPMAALLGFTVLSGQRQVSKFLASAAMHAHVIGDDAEAVAILLDFLRLTRAQDAQPTLVNHVVAVACHALASRTIEVIAVDLAVHQDGGGDADTSGAASRRDVEELVHALLDTESYRNAIVRVFQVERLLVSHVAGQLARGDVSFSATFGMGPQMLPTLADRLLAIPLRPAWIASATSVLRRMSAEAAAAGSSNWPAASDVFNHEETGSATLGPFLRPFSTWDSSHQRVFLLHCQGLAITRMAATALAIRLYQLDNGHRPASLAELVPAYLPSMPLDPFSDDDAPLQYIADGDAPRLYSIGPNGVDDGGMTAIHANGRFNLDRRDIVFPLAGKRPTVPNGP